MGCKLLEVVAEKASNAEMRQTQVAAEGAEGTSTAEEPLQEIEN